MWLSPSLSKVLKTILYPKLSKGKKNNVSGKTQRVIGQKWP